MNAFWSAIDISENIERALGAIRGLRGVPALVLAAALALITYGLFWLVLYFDVDATLEWTRMAAEIIAPTVPPRFAEFSAYLVLSITLMPTLVELFAARFARAGIVIASGFIFAFSLFDMVTDWPRVVTFMAAYRDAFSAFGWFAWPLFQVTRLLWLFMASFGFEALFCVFLVAILALLLQAGMGRSGRRGAASYRG